MVARTSADYATLAKVGFLLGLGLFVTGAAGELIGHAAFGGLPGWEDALFFDLEAAGILLGLLSPFVFGVALPLVEG